MKASRLERLVFGGVVLLLAAVTAEVTQQLGLVASQSAAAPGWGTLLQLRGIQFKGIGALGTADIHLRGTGGVDIRGFRFNL